jgi:hypothetical protein
MNTLESTEVPSHAGPHTIRVTVTREELVTSIINFVAARYGAGKYEGVSELVVDVILDRQHAIEFFNFFNNKKLLSLVKMKLEVMIEISVFILFNFHSVPNFQFLTMRYL